MLLKVVFHFQKKWNGILFIVLFHSLSLSAEDYPFNYKDTNSIKAAIEKSYTFLINDFQDSSFFLANKTYSASLLANYQFGIARSNYILGLNEIYLSNLDKAVEKILEAKAIYETIHNEEGITDCMKQIGVTLYAQKKFPDAIIYFLKTLPMYSKLGDTKNASTIGFLLGLSYLETGSLNESEKFLLQAEKEKLLINDEIGLYEVKMGLGNLYLKKELLDNARNEFLTCYDYFLKKDNKQAMAVSLLGLANVYQHLNNDSSLIFFEKALAVATLSKHYDVQMKAAEKLRGYYSKVKDTKNELYYLKIYYETKDKLFNEQNAKTIANLKYSLDLEKKQSEINLLNNKRTIDKILLYALLAGVLLLLVTSISWYKRYSYKRETNLQLIKVNNELETTLKNLRSTQEQLIQSEKLASLGQVTAGIAHEIKNPLNFVTNFSQVSAELANELLTTSSEQDRKEIAENLKTNLARIIKHSSRADSIVQSMLEHSRNNSGEKQLTDINRICDEYINFALMGMRAMNPAFTCELVKEFNPTLPKIYVNQQEISRTILNIASNAFYAVDEKQKSEAEKGSNNYLPQVLVTTSAFNHSILISIHDNGKGIPDHMKDKIFNPFFTTKPSGQGTGLGLSISFEIIKAHQGEIKVSSKENEFTEFTITLPI